MYVYFIHLYVRKIKNIHTDERVFWEEWAMGEILMSAQILHMLWNRCFAQIVGRNY